MSNVYEIQQLCVSTLGSAKTPAISQAINDFHISTMTYELRRELQRLEDKITRINMVLNHIKRIQE